MGKAGNLMGMLMELEKKCRMDVCAPADYTAVQRLAGLSPALPQEVVELYRISDGVEINVPGTRIFPAFQIERTVPLQSAGRATVIGAMGFGDEIAACADGRIIQIDHETGNVFLEWGSLTDFLADELAMLKEGSV